MFAHDHDDDDCVLLADGIIRKDDDESQIPQLRITTPKVHQYQLHVARRQISNQHEDHLSTIKHDDEVDCGTDNVVALNCGGAALAHEADSKNSVCGEVRLTNTIFFKIHTDDEDTSRRTLKRSSSPRRRVGHEEKAKRKFLSKFLCKWKKVHDDAM